MKLYMKILLLFTLAALSSNTFARKEIMVGGYEFPPFVSINDGKPQGMTLDLIELLNKSQNKYLFKFTLTTSKRRYKDFSENKYSLIFFENIIWGWQAEPIAPSRVILNGGEVFIAKAIPGRDESFFNTLKDKTILGIIGYHYKFANLVTNREYLQKYFKMELGTGHRENINSVIDRDSPMIAIVTKSYLNLFLSKNPTLRSKLLISSKFDQIYRHTILVRQNTAPGISEINELIDKLKKKGELDKVWQKYGIKN